MKRFFRRSQATGLVYELVNYSFVLLCGYLLSDLLELTMDGAWQQVYHQAVFTGAALVASLVPRYLMSLRRSRVQLEDTQQFREFLYGEVQKRCVDVKSKGEMNVRLTGDVRTVAQYFQKTCPKAISGLVIMITSAILLCVRDWRVGSIFFVLNLTQLLPILVYEKWARQIYNQTHNDEEAYCNWMLEGYNGIRTIKAYDAQAWFMKRYYQLNQAIVNSGKRAEQVGTVENIIFNAIDTLLNYGSYVIIGGFVLWGNLGIDEVPFLVIVGGYLFSSISSIFEMRLQQFDYQEACKRIGLKNGTEVQREEEYIIKVENIVKAYEEKRVLQGVSCVIRDGEHVLLRGDNGSGKSTLLRIMMGLEEADSGKVVCGVSEKNRAISLQEEPELNISGVEVVEGLMDAGRVDRQALVRHFQEFQMEDLLSKPLSQLSPGERKKFYLAAALAHRGSLLVLDEPTNHVDQDSIGYLVKVLRDYPGTMIVCTHAPEIDLIWNKILRMEGGVCHES